jgi:lysine/ornithine N-monooxygenase
MPDRSNLAVAIIGAGPYGLSIAAHLKPAGVDFRIFGKPLHRWLHQMPKGMFLKSEARASNLSEPTRRSTLTQYCADKGMQCEEAGRPVPLDLFTEYALWFQQKHVPEVEQTTVTSLDASPGGFELRLSDGATLRARNVVVATGLDHAVFIPPELACLPPELLSHSADHHDPSRFREKDVTVIGAGQSALELAALVLEAGASSVRLLVRRPSLMWNLPSQTGPSPLYRRIRYPASNLGHGLGLWFCANAPMLFRCLPERVRLEKAVSTLGPAGAAWLKDRILGRVQIMAGRCVRSAEASAGRALLEISEQHGQPVELVTEHVIAATGYRFDLRRLPFLSPDLNARVRIIAQQPLLSSGFESSVRGLYFAGLASANSFGPAMRFLHGAAYTARSVSHHIAVTQRRYSAPRALQLANAGS